jgi:hypothetical protein
MEAHEIINAQIAREFGATTAGRGRKRGGHLYRCLEPAMMETQYGPDEGTCGGWLKRLYERVGAKGRYVAVGWRRERCHAYVDGDDPHADVDMEALVRFHPAEDEEEMMHEFWRRPPPGGNSAQMRERKDADVD